MEVWRKVIVLAQAVSINFGYTGMWLSQIARASLEYKVPMTVVPQLTARATTE